MDYSNSPVFDNVKYEKAKAAARYSRYRTMSRVLQVLEVLVVGALISWSSTRLSSKISGGAVIEFCRYVCNPHVVFLIGNAIVAVLFLFRRAVAGNETSGEIYDDYVSHSDRKPFVAEEIITVPTAVQEEEIHGGYAAEKVKPIPEPEEEKQIVCVFEEKKVQCDVVSEAIETATKQIEKFQRTQSVKLRREIAPATKPRSTAALRRSETVKERGRIKPVSVETVEKLSDEEFNMTIEAYIKRHREFISGGDEITPISSG